MALTRSRLKLPFSTAADWQKVLIFILAWGGALTFALSRITIHSEHDPQLWTLEGYGLKYGYTMSLSLIVLPLVSLVWWYHVMRKTDTDGKLRRLVRATIKDSAIAGFVFVIFDALFATKLFSFPDSNATVGLMFWGYMWSGDCSTLWNVHRVFSCYERTIPIEEIIFYVGGAAVLRGTYLWASEDFVNRYSMSDGDYVLAAKRVPRLVKVNWAALVVMLTILAIGIYLKHRLDGGFPIYLMLQALIVSSPVVLLYTTVRDFVNTRALLMVMVLQALVSVIWEATAALPYGWWNYKPEGMIGIPVPPWSNLPIEASLFWISVGWSAIFLQEVTKIKVRSERRWRDLLFGRKPGVVLPAGEAV
jgi:hypothetical protein